METTINDCSIEQKKAFIFGAAFFFKKKNNLKQYPEMYKRAKMFIGNRATVMGLTQFPKDRHYGPDYRSLTTYWRLMFESLTNDEWRVDAAAQRIWSNYDYAYNTTGASDEQVQELFKDVTTRWPDPAMPYSRDTLVMAKTIFKEEDFGLLGPLADTLEDSGHCEEAQHFLCGDHTPACSLLMKLKNTPLRAPEKKDKVFQF